MKATVQEVLQRGDTIGIDISIQGDKPGDKPALRKFVQEATRGGGLSISTASGLVITIRMTD